MKKFIVFLAIVSLAVPSASFAETIRVALALNQKAVTLASPSGLVVAGDQANGSKKKMTVYPASIAGASMRVRPAAGFIQVNGKSYRGAIELRKTKNGRLLVINELGLEDYLKGVIASEIPHTWEFEALKAQAVASRSYALYQKQNVEKRPYHILATVHDQVYNGGSAERRNALRAVQETNGLIITHRGHVIPAFYHSSCGGHTENAALLWGIDASYLKGVECECQEISKYGLWEKRVKLSKVVTALKRLGYGVSDIADLGIENITAAGRVRKVMIQTAGLTTLVPAETLRAALGNTVIPSVFFELERDGDEAIFSGRGSGHGVGLCQWGAREMAQRGYDFRAILSHYYPGTTMSRMR